MSQDEPSPDITVVVPVYNEEDNVGVLTDEILAALDGRRYEVIFVNDCSTDSTLDRLKELKARHPQVRVLSHERNGGQSRSVRNAVAAARAPVIVTIDGDLQNDPADIPRLVDHLNGVGGGPRYALVGGRRRKRRDTMWKRLGSRIGNGVRKWLLKDGADDTACGLKTFRREVHMRLPFFSTMHRFLPALMIREGQAVGFLDVHHRPRVHGESKYSNIGRLAVSIPDLFGVMWLNARARRSGAVEEV
ncbi:MAG: glycosyltransferase family 2 protein [Caulobacterales bacterium]|nr:glycosyltransferase family 2 protein [Caulobacterales bacterium]